MAEFILGIMIGFLMVYSAFQQETREFQEQLERNKKSREKLINRLDDVERKYDLREKIGNKNDTQN